MYGSLKIILGVGALVVSSAGVIAAQSTYTANRLATDDSFITKAVHGGAAEVELGELAKSRALNPKVKGFGQRMIDDHSKINDELKKIAVQKGITIPSSLDAKDEATKERLSNLNGSEFDRAYIRDMIADHREDIAEFNREATSGHDPDVKSFASKTLPTLREHLKLAEEVSKEP